MAIVECVPVCYYEHLVPFRSGSVCGLVSQNLCRVRETSARCKSARGEVYLLLRSSARQRLLHLLSVQTLREGFKKKMPFCVSNRGQADVMLCKLHSLLHPIASVRFVISNFEHHQEWTIDPQTMHPREVYTSTPSALRTVYWPLAQRCTLGASLALTQ